MHIQEHTCCLQKGVINVDNFISFSIKIFIYEIDYYEILLLLQIFRYITKLFDIKHVIFLTPI